MVGRRRIICFIVLALAGCQTRARSLAPVEPSVEHLVFDLGTPCSAEGDCASGFCVDGVCCDSACGGGVRDLLSCSSVYGAVNGLVDGSCTTLRRGDPCGVVIAAEPCLWLGSRVNGGGHCTPPSETVGSACFPCVNAADCGGAFPVCVDGACGGCDGNFGDGTSAACPVASPVCNNGQCGGCGDCAGLAPACDGLTGMCSPCNGDYGSDATLPCPRGESPACLGNGACASCSATNTTACEGATPACDTATSSCASCNGDYGSAATRACADLDAPLCLAGGGCGRCNTSADCNGGDVCLPALGTCGPPCASDAQCATGAWCAVGVCTPKLPNGSALPAAALGAGTCVDKHAARACLSGTCSDTDQVCGLPNDTSCSADSECISAKCFEADLRCGMPFLEACSTPAVCRSRNCSPLNTCGECRTDADCGDADSGIICDGVDRTCKPGCRGEEGNGCAGGRICSSTDERVGKCSQCIDDAGCGASGRVCNESRACVNGCRGEGGNGCGPESVCSSSDGTIGTCSSDGPASCSSSGGSDLSLAVGGLAVFAIAVARRLKRRSS